jgi:hypothetical protein
VIEFVLYPLVVIAVVGLCAAAFKYPKPFDRAVLPGILATVFLGCVWEAAISGYVIGLYDNVDSAIAADRFSNLVATSWLFHPGFAYLPFVVVFMLLNTLPLIRNHLLEGGRNDANSDGK